ncbi:uncharacterized protein TRIADDRAFT_31975 [Trichoplax adhaerens]|uniref:Carboxylesterase type B domain-containing protein n=1 Tax=Trichoplax adhaerens TaxID=10228 RepID=B3SA28_TRIAD|nr:hypothetical protein TRIADDRAFT_31975 [Trichoplax adhaerens]EDV20444.1 hypothetical protein TRIADDRAFT_31975 [Trichoplax adhaerens]|eukprot:XP_002117138.1 hypothetical protein TRIADDRAFT_31975 [Trichoplax adhaerens]
MKLTSFFILFSIVINSLITQSFSSVIVTTNYGDVIGRSGIINGKQVSFFLGLPYAIPPLGKYRFQAPQPIPQSSGRIRRYDARLYKPSCIQPTPIPWTNPTTAQANIHEDCLYLNVFTPSLNKTDKLPVFVWIDGTSSTEGSGSRWMATTLASQANVVVVTFNYRLGVFGFLTTAELKSHGRQIPANIALLDQQVALRWVQDNIDHFGGNPRAVTVGGDGLGATAAQLHTLIPSSYNYIHNLILQSGNVRMVHTIESNIHKARSIFRLFVAEVGCLGQNHTVTQQVNCLQRLSTRKLFQGQKVLTQQYWRFFKYVVDGVLIRDHPRILLDQGNFKKVNLIVGYNLNDSAKLIQQLPHQNQGIHRDIFLLLIDTLFDEFNHAIRRAIIHEYTNWQNVSSPIFNLRQADKLITDSLYAAPTEYIANIYSRDSSTSTFVYLYSYRGSNPDPYYPSQLGVSNTMEIPYVFGYPVAKPNYYATAYTMTDRQVSLEVMSLWGNFIHHG